MREEILADARERMQKSLSVLGEALTRIRTGRAHPSLLDPVKVEYYGTEVPIAQVGSVTVEEGRTLVVQVWEKNMVEAVEKALLNSDLGITPTSAGQVVRLPMPPLTEERRRVQVRHVKETLEEARVSIRNVRRDANHMLKDLLKEKEISEDEERRDQEAVQKLTDDSIHQAEQMAAEKEKALLEI